MPDNILDDILDLVKEPDAFKDPVIENTAPRVPDLSPLQKLSALSRGVRQLGVDAFVNFPASIAQAVSPIDLSFSQPLVDYLNEELGAAQAQPEGPPLPPRAGANLAEIRQDTGAITGIPERLLRATGLGPLYEQARKESDTSIGAAAKTLSEATIGPLTQRTSLLPDIPAVLDEERKTETEVQRLERLPESIAQASILYSIFAGGLGFFKKAKEPTFKAAKTAVRQVEKDAAIMNELAKRKITDGIKEGVEVYTPEGKGKIIEVVGLEDIKSGLSKGAKKKYFKGVQPKDPRTIIQLEDGRQIGYKPDDIVVNPRSVMDATGLKPGRLLIDPVRLKKLIDDEVGALDPETTGKFLNDVIRTAGPALAHKVGQLMKEEPGLQVMQAVGRAVAQGEAPEVQIAAMANLYKIPMDKAAEMSAANFRVAGETIAKGNFKFNNRQLANMMEIAGMMDPEVSAQLHRSAKDLYLDNPVTRGRFNSAMHTWKQLKDGGMLGTVKGFARDFRSSLTRGTVIQAFEDLVTDTTVAAGSPIAQRIMGSREAAGLPTKDLSQVFANTIGTIQAIGLGGQRAVLRTKDMFQALDIDSPKHDPRVRKWVSDASWAELKGDKIPEFPKGVVRRTELDAILDLAQQFPEKYHDLNRSIGGDSFVNMVAVDQIAKASSAAKAAKKNFNIQTGGRAIIEGLKAGANVLTSARSLADIEIKRIGVAARILTHSQKTGKAIPELMRELQDINKLSPVTEQAFLDAFSHGRDITYSNRFEGTPIERVLQTFRKHPILYTISSVEYPGFHFNKLNYHWERNPIRSGLSMVKPTTLRKLAGELDPTELRSNLDALGILDPESPQGLMISKALKERNMQEAAREYARFASGMTQLSLAIGIRTSKFAGPRHFEIDESAITGVVGPNGERDIKSLEYDEPLSTWLGIAEAMEKTQQGIPLNDVFTKQEILNLAIGTRNLDQNSVFALNEIAEIFDRNADETGPAVGRVAQELLDNELGKFFGWTRQFKEVAALADMRAMDLYEGKDEMYLPDPMQTDLPQITGILPRGVARENLIPPSGMERATIYETSGMAKRDLTAMEALFGLKLDKQIPLQRFMGAAGLNIRDAVGTGFPDPLMDKVHMMSFNNILQEQLNDKGLTIGNAIIIMANDLASAAANSPEPTITIRDQEFNLLGPKTAIFHEVRRFVAQKAFESIRAEARENTLLEFRASDPVRLEKFYEQQYPRLVRPAIKEFFNELRQERLRLNNEHK